jgi:hypothetical protein
MTLHRKEGTRLKGCLSSGFIEADSSTVPALRAKKRLSRDPSVAAPSWVLATEDGWEDHISDQR